MEQIPDHVFDLLNQKEFQQLNDAEQADVLACMDEQTYTSMRNATILAQRYIKEEPTVQVHPKRMQFLRNTIETRQLAEPTIVWTKPIAFWKVASLLLLLGGGWLVWLAANQHKVVTTSYITQLDTVFVEKEIPAEKIHDTVYIEYERKRHQHHRSDDDRLPSEAYAAYRQEATMVTTSDVNIVPLNEKDEPINNKKGNSIKDDSLIQAFGFVTL